MIEIFTRQDPYPEMNAFDVGSGVLDGSLAPELPKSAPVGILVQMKKIFERDPTLRPSFEELCETLDVDFE